MSFDMAIYTHRKWVLLDTAYVNKNLFLCCHFMINFLYAQGVLYYISSGFARDIFCGGRHVSRGVKN